MNLRLVVCAIGMMVCVPMWANDSAASVSIGGIVLTREPQISMEKERLTISLAKVIVEYEFLNTSDADISTEVAFPIPAYKEDMGAGGVRDFNDFKLWVDGRPLKYGVEAKAFLNGKDVTAELAKYKLDVTTLGHYTDNQGVSKDFTKLTAAQKKEVADLGLFSDPAGEIPEWEVRKTYHWTQSFPAHKVLHVKHAYTPAFGFQGIRDAMFDDAARAKLMGDDKKQSTKDDDMVAEDSREQKVITDACVDPTLEKTMYSAGSGYAKVHPNAGDYIETQWVDYIVTTANSWKTPIKDFTLVLEKAQPDSWVSLCWDGPIKKVDALRFEAHATDFVPTKELHVDFFSVMK